MNDLFDVEDAKSLFEYLVRKALSELTLPMHGKVIRCDNVYYQVDWKGVEPITMWKTLFGDDLAAATAMANVDDLESLFDAAIKTFTANLSVRDPYSEEFVNMKLGDLHNWEYAKRIPKRY